MNQNINNDLMTAEAPKKIRKQVIGKAPFLRAVDEGKISTTRMMIDLLIALGPIILFAWFKNGILPAIELDNVGFMVVVWPILFVIIGALTSMILEGLYFAIFKQVKGFKNVLSETWHSYAIIPGVLLALILPLYTPIWMLMLGCLVANILFKMLFGGFGHNVFNPALMGYVFVIAAFGGVIGNSYMSPSDIFNNTAGVTPLANYSGNLGGSYESLVGSYGNLWDFLIGTIPGSLGETSALLCIVAYVYLVIRKVINWYTPVVYVGTVFVLTWIIGAINGQGGIWYPTFNILSGGLLFGAVFMATEPVTGPKTPNGKVIFAIFLGLLTTLFRLIGAMNEGVATSILFMCLFSNVIDKYCAKVRSNPSVKNAVIKYAMVAVLMLAIATYTIIKAAPKKAETVEVPTAEIVEYQIGGDING